MSRLNIMSRLNKTEALEGSPSYPMSQKIFLKVSHIPEKWQISQKITKIQKTLYRHIPKIL